MSGHPISVLGAVARPLQRRPVVIVALAFRRLSNHRAGQQPRLFFAQNFLHQRGIVASDMAAGAGVAGLLAGRRTGIEPADDA